MKNFRRKFTTILAVALLVCLSISSVASAKENYTYTVTFHAGAQGTFGSTAGLSVDGSEASVAQSADKIVITGLKAGDVVSFNAQSAVNMDADSKHYVQGVRLSGRDNDTVSASAFTVDADRDYVVAYGIKGNVVGYSVYYQDADGNELLDADTFYGNVGDKPVVAAKYVEGYEPQVLGFTKTLSENEADNVFVFVYDELQTNDVIEEVPGDGADDDADGAGAGNAGADDDANAADGDANAGDGADDDANAGDEDANAGDEDGDGIVDLDDEETPLANVDADNGGKGLPMAGMIAILVVALAALVGIVFFVKKRSQKN